MGSLRRVNRHHHEHAGVQRPDCKTKTAHRGRQEGCCNAYTVLNIERGNIDIGSDAECYVHRHQTVIRIIALHVLHARSTVDLLFNRSCHGLLYGQCIGSRKLTVHLYDRRRDLRILFNRQAQNTNDTCDHQYNRNDNSGDGPFNKRISDHGLIHRPIRKDFIAGHTKIYCAFCLLPFPVCAERSPDGAIGEPLCSDCIPSDTIISPSSIPFFIITFGPSIAPSCTFF